MTVLQDFLESMDLISHASTGNTSAAIVAVPRAMDPVRLIGDEEKHATLLFFGETSKLPEDAKKNLINLLTQASRIFFPFNERIKSVERLGEEEPPALVGMLSNQQLGLIRGALLLNEDVAEYLKNTNQYPSFTPHTTFGYPTYAEEPDIRKKAQQVYNVSFDRISLWWNDERYDFDLDTYPKTESEYSDSLAYAELVGPYLEQHGVKGQRWGVRKDAVASWSPGSGNGTIVSKPGGVSPTKADVKIMVKAMTKIDAHFMDPDKGPFRPNGPMTALNAKPIKDQKTYNGEFSRVLHEEAQPFAPKGMTVMAAVDRETQSVEMLMGYPETVQELLKAAAHADSDVVRLRYDLVLDEDNKVTGLKKKDTIQHEETLSISDRLQKFLEHHGVLGQRWGIRRTAAQLASGRKSSEKIPASEDAINAVKAQLKVKQAGSLNVLSTKELQNLVDRMNLEDRYVKATVQSSPTTKKGEGFVKKFIKNEIDTFQRTGAPSKGVQLLNDLLNPATGGKHKA